MLGGRGGRRGGGSQIATGGGGRGARGGGGEEGGGCRQAGIERVRMSWRRRHSASEAHPCVACPCRHLGLHVES